MNDNNAEIYLAGDFESRLMRRRRDELNYARQVRNSLRIFVPETSKDTGPEQISVANHLTSTPQHQQNMKPTKEIENLYGVDFKMLEDAYKAIEDAHENAPKELI